MMKSIFKRSVALLMCIAMMLALLPHYAMADDDQQAQTPAASQTEQAGKEPVAAKKAADTDHKSKNVALDTDVKSEPDAAKKQEQPEKAAGDSGKDAVPVSSTGNAAATPTPESAAQSERSSGDKQTQTPAPEKADAALAKGESASPAVKDGQTEYTVTFLDWDGSQIAKQQVDAGDDVVFPDHPTRTRFRPDGWDADGKNIGKDLVITALYRALNVYTITIHYAYAGSRETAHAPFIAQVQEGEDLSKTVTSPTIAGYTPDHSEIVLNQPDVRADKTYLVLYTGAEGTRYTVVHRYENVCGTGYETVTETLSGATGELTQAQPDIPAGFICADGPEQAKIASDGSTRVVISYTRLFHYVVFDSAGGSNIAPIAARYGARLTLPAAPTRPGYTFAGWDQPLPETMPADTDLTLTARWTPDNTTYTLAYWQENADDDGYTFIETATQTARSGSVAAPPASAISNTRYTYFTYSRYDAGVSVNGDGTTIVNVYYARSRYTLTFQVYRSFGWNTVATITAKYGASITNRFPISGYEGRAWEATSTYDDPLQTLDQMPGQNITFHLYAQSSTQLKTIYYSPVSMGAYVVQHFLQNQEQDGYTLVQTQEYFDKPVAATVTAMANDYEGFAFAPAISRTRGVVPESGALVLQLYYTRQSYPYTVRYLEQGTDGPGLIPDDTGSALYKTRVSANSRAILGYRLVSGQDATKYLTISATQEDNVIVFYYEQQNDLAYAVEYVDRGGTGSVLSTIGPVTVDYGSPVQVIAPPSIVVNGVTYTLYGENQQGVDSFVKSQVFRFFYDAVTYSVQYDGNGNTAGTPPVDNAQYRPGQSVAALDRNTLVRSGLKFLGWTLSPQAAVNSTQAQEDAIRGQLISTFAMPAKDVTLYAVWAESIYREYTVIYYMGDADSGLAPVDSGYYAMGEQATVRGDGTLIRAGYRFAGWQARTSLGEPTGTVYFPKDWLIISGNVALYPVWTPVPVKPTPTTKPTPAPTKPTVSPTVTPEASPAAAPIPEATPVPAPTNMATPIPTSQPSGRGNGGREPGSWALLNLLLVLATALISALALVGYLGKRHRKDTGTSTVYDIKQHGFLRLMTLIPALGELIVFILTENMRLTMVWTDDWTQWMVVIGLVQLLLVSLCMKPEKEQNEADV